MNTQPGDTQPPILPMTVRRSKSDPNIVRISVDGKLVARLRAVTASSLALRTGMAYTPQLEAAIRAELQCADLRRRALRLLAVRGRYAASLAQKLRDRGGTPATVNRVIDELLEDGWINDARQAEHDAQRLVERGRALTPAAVAARLIARGCDPQRALSAATAAITPGEARDAGLAHARRRLARMKGLPPRTRLRRITADLARRGLSEEDLRWIFDQLHIDPESDTGEGGEEGNWPDRD